MMYLFLGILLFSLLVMAVVVVRKFPQLSNVDVDNLPEEKEARKKKEIIDRRVQAEGASFLKRLLGLFKPLDKAWRQFQLKFRIYVGKIERLWHRESRKNKKQPAIVEEKENKFQQLLNDAVIHRQQGDYEKAESYYIAAIKIDSRSVEAYRGLADTYLEKGSLEEAQETYQFLLQLAPNDDALMVKVAELAEQKGDINTAINYYQQAIVLKDSLSPRYYHLAELLLKINEPATAKEAIMSAVELEPKNPKYLDLLVEIGILCGDKDLAVKGVHELRLVNPKNQKLQVFNDRIKEMV